MSGKFQNKNNNFSQNPIKNDRDVCSRAENYMEKKEYRLAVKEYLVSILMDKSNVGAYKGASKAYKNLKEYDKAIRHLKSARKVYGFDSEIYYELGLNYLLNRDSENAMKNFKRSIKLTPENKLAQLKLALSHELEGEDDMAILVYKTIIEKNLTYIPAISHLANLYLEKGEYLVAIEFYKRIVKINKDYYRAYLGIGLCFDEMGKYVNATRYYKKYISYKPYCMTSKSLAARIYNIYKYKLRTPEGAKLKIVT